jgi:hypothetical protein
MPSQPRSLPPITFPLDFSTSRTSRGSPRNPFGVVSSTYSKLVATDRSVPMSKWCQSAKNSSHAQQTLAKESAGSSLSARAETQPFGSLHRRCTCLHTTNTALSCTTSAVMSSPFFEGGIPEAITLCNTENLILFVTVQKGATTQIYGDPRLTHHIHIFYTRRRGDVNAS